ncbi:ABC transporter permease [Kribbella sp. NBC_00382]
MSTTIAILASLAMEFRPNASPVDWLAAIGLLLLYVVALFWLAAALGVIAKSVESASALSFAMLFLPYLSSAFVRTETMPRFLQPISKHPADHAGDRSRPQLSDRYCVRLERLARTRLVWRPARLLDSSRDGALPPQNHSTTSPRTRPLGAWFEPLSFWCFENRREPATLTPDQG